MIPFACLHSTCPFGPVHHMRSWPRGGLPNRLAHAATFSVKVHAHRQFVQCSMLDGHRFSDERSPGGPSDSASSLLISSRLISSPALHKNSALHDWIA